MADDFVLISVTPENAQQAGQLKSLALNAASVYSQVVSIRNKMTHMYEGTNFTRLEKEFGVPTGKGQEVFDMLNGAVLAMDGATQNPQFKTLTEKVG